MSGTVSEGDDTKVIGLKVTEWVAVIALVLSLGNLGWAFISRQVGAVITPLPLRHVEFRCSLSWEDYYSYPDERGPNDKPPCDNIDAHVTITGDSLTFINEGEPGYNGVIMHATAEASWATKTLKFKWKYFTNITSLDWGFSPAQPIVIPARGAATREVSFSRISQMNP